VAAATAARLPVIPRSISARRSVVAVEHEDRAGRARPGRVQDDGVPRRGGSGHELGDLVVVEAEQLREVRDADAGADAGVGVDGDAVGHAGTSGAGRAAVRA
jgi:hypothetical protein